MLTARGALIAFAAVALNGCLPCSAEPLTGTPADVAQTLARLSIDLPKDVVGTTAVRRPLEELTRERCDQDAILHLAKALDDLDYRREAAVAQVNFSSQCGGYGPALRGAVNLLLKLSDYTTAETVASDLVRLEPFNDNGYYLRALARDGNRSFKGAIDDYVTAIELFGNKDRISSVSYYKMARDYERLEPVLRRDAAHRAMGRSRSVAARYQPNASYIVRLRRQGRLRRGDVGQRRNFSGTGHRRHRQGSGHYQ